MRKLAGSSNLIYRAQILLIKCGNTVWRSSDKKKEDSEDTEELKLKLSSKSVSGAIPPKRISNNILTLRSKIADCGGKIPPKIGCFDPTKGKTSLERLEEGR